jgi:hypothetical protein
LDLLGKAAAELEKLKCKSHASGAGGVDNVSMFTVVVNFYFRRSKGLI